MKDTTNLILIATIIVVGVFSIVVLIRGMSQMDILYKFTNDDIKQILKKVKESKSSQTTMFMCSNLIERDNWEVADKNLAVKIINEYYFVKEK